MANKSSSEMVQKREQIQAYLVENKWRELRPGVFQRNQVLGTVDTRVVLLPTVFKLRKRIGGCYKDVYSSPYARIVIEADPRSSVFGKLLAGTNVL